ncbi:MAG: hypothetical protein QY312_04045 [Candidatus Dojkabacteria bacterium]|nr:MAG: hypothetical protein QY312_04045 [Candidatus Dojkabacteria bacterium]
MAPDKKLPYETHARRAITNLGDILDIPELRSVALDDGESSQIKVVRIDVKSQPIIIAIDVKNGEGAINFGTKTSKQTIRELTLSFQFSSSGTITGKFALTQTIQDSERRFLAKLRVTSQHKGSPIFNSKVVTLPFDDTPQEIRRIFYDYFARATPAEFDEKLKNYIQSFLVSD